MTETIFSNVDVDVDGDVEESDPFACFGSDDDDDDDGEDDHEHDGITSSSDSGATEQARLLMEEATITIPIIERLPVRRPDCFEVFDAPGAGKGLRALKKYSCGDEILREAAAMRVPNQQAASSREEAEALHRKAVQASFDGLHPMTQRAIMDLSSCEISHNNTVLGMYQTNSFQLGDEPDGGLFLTIARINHSCRPNVTHMWRPDLQKTLVFAQGDIAIGDEICTMYGPSECLDTAGRGSYLKERFSFDCLCPMCTEGNHSSGGDDRMRKINSLQEDISLLAATGQPEAAMDALERCLALLAQQGIGSGAFVRPLLHYGYQVALAGLHDEVLARSYLTQELRAVTDCEGVDSPGAVRIQQLLLDTIDLNENDQDNDNDT